MCFHKKMFYSTKLTKILLYITIENNIKKGGCMVNQLKN